MISPTLTLSQGGDCHGRGLSSTDKGLLSVEEMPRPSPPQGGDSDGVNIGM